MTIDWWTLGFQTVNVVILMWLLARFFWRPLAAMIALRQSTTQQAMDAAKAKSAEAVTALENIAQTRAGFAKERAALLEAAQSTADVQHTARMDQAEQEAAALITAATTQLAKDAAATDHAWTERASRLAVDIATRLLTPLAGPAMRGAFFDRLIAQIGSLPDTERCAIAPDGAALVAVSAEPLDAAEQASNVTAIGAALQTSPTLTFKVEPGLIAGLELRGPHMVVGNSLHDDLQRILLDLTHESA